jgi:hypothetical protein
VRLKCNFNLLQVDEYRCADESWEEVKIEERDIEDTSQEVYNKEVLHKGIVIEEVEQVKVPCA